MFVEENFKIKEISTENTFEQTRANANVRVCTL